MPFGLGKVQRFFLREVPNCDHSHLFSVSQETDFSVGTLFIKCLNPTTNERNKTSGNTLKKIQMNLLVFATHSLHISILDFSLWYSIYSTVFVLFSVIYVSFV